MKMKMPLYSGCRPALPKSASKDVSRPNIRIFGCPYKDRIAVTSTQMKLKCLSDTLLLAVTVWLSVPECTKLASKPHVRK